jgi:predicted ATPase/transcriptional regulator with XRE-family HTH domain
MAPSFGTWVKRRRKALDLTQQELAKQIGCSPSLIFKIESDERRPSRQMADLLAEKLDIPADQRPLFLKIARQEKSANSLDAIPPLSPLAPASAPEPRHTHLPVSPTSLIGREDELSLISNQLLQPSCRMLTLTGPGGIGKTRLAIEVGRNLEPHFTDGIHFISLAGVGMPESILPAIADVLGIGFSGPADLMVQFTNSLHDKEILLILDNMEHLLDGRDLLGEILQKTHHAKMLVTSREQLRLQWEWLFEVQGLPLPEGNEAEAEHNSAIELFIQRAKQTSQTFSLDTEDLSAIIRICRLVGGIPLAIELAASWARMFSAREIAQELEKNLDLLETRKLDVPQRHRSIKTVFDHSWKMLSENERELLMKLSVFQASFTREAALKVTGASLFLLSALVDKSLLRHSNNPDRYELHELVRAYALTQLQNVPAEEEEAALKYAIHYADWIQSLEWEFKSPRQAQVSQIIRAETCNWHCTWHWAIDNHDLNLLRRMIPTLNWYFEVNGSYDEAISAFKTAVEHFRMQGAPVSLKTAEEKSTFAFILDSLGWFEFRKGNAKLGVQLLGESLEIARQHDDPEVMYYIHGNWGYLALILGDIPEAERLTQISLEYGKKLETWHTAIPMSVLGIVDYQRGELEKARHQLAESLSIWRPVGDPRGLVFTMLYMGMTFFALKDLSAAQAILRESNQIAEDNMDRWAHALGLDLLGMVSLEQGQVEEALTYFQKSAAFSKEIGDSLNGTQTAIHLGQACATMRSNEEAKRLYVDAYTNAKAAKWTPIILNALVAYTEIPDVLPAETRLAVALSVLAHPAVTPNIRARSEAIQDQVIPLLTTDQIESAHKIAEGTSPEDWAQELLK